jgi:hypothetical protein
VLIGDLDGRSFVTEAAQGDAAEDIGGDGVFDAKSIVLRLPALGVLFDPGFGC